MDLMASVVVQDGLLDAALMQLMKMLHRCPALPITHRCGRRHYACASLLYLCATLALYAAGFFWFFSFFVIVIVVLLLLLVLVTVVSSWTSLVRWCRSNDLGSLLFVTEWCGEVVGSVKFLGIVVASYSCGV